MCKEIPGELLDVGIRPREKRNVAIFVEKRCVPVCREGLILFSSAVFAGQLSESVSESEK